MTDRVPPPWHESRAFSFGFAAGLAMAFACLVASVAYLITFQSDARDGVGELIRSVSIETDREPESGSVSTTMMSERTFADAITARLVMADLSLNSCGIFLGMAFGFLGFSLFLIGVQGAMQASGEGPGYKVQIANLSPGVAVIICATTLICVSVTNIPTFKASSGTSHAAPPMGEPPPPPSSVKTGG